MNVSDNEQAEIGLSVCLIVRDNEQTIRPCLESIRPWVDELVVVDTGSNDATPRIAQEYGARLFHFPWCDDFSAARNESFRHARGRWLFWMDSDDTITPECGKELRELAARPHAESTLGFVMQVHCPGRDSQNDVTIVDHVKLVRNHPELRFEGRIHEQLLLSVRRLQGEVAWTDIYVVHSGSDQSAEGRKRKQERDLRLLELELRDYPEHPFALFNIGMTYSDMEEHEKAVTSLRQCLDVSQPGESHVRKAYALLVNSFALLDRYDEAQAACDKGRELFPLDRELQFRNGMICHHVGCLDEAVNSYRAAIRGGEDRHFSSVDHGIGGFKARHNLALVYKDMGRADLAEIEWREVVREAPSYQAGRKSLALVLLQQNKIASAEIEADKLLRDEPSRSHGPEMRAEIHLAQGEVLEARRLLETALKDCPNEIDVRQTLCRILFEHGAPLEAESALIELIALVPEDAAAHHNLGQVQLNLGKHEAAEASFRLSLKLRPKSAHTLLQLGYTLRAMNRDDDAQQVWLQAKELAPEDPLVVSVVTSTLTSS